MSYCMYYANGDEDDKTDEGAEMWRDAVVGMLEYLIEQEKE